MAAKKKTKSSTSKKMAKLAAKKKPARTPKPATKAAAKKAPSKPSATGRMPPPLPKLKGALAKAITEIAAIEKLGFHDTADAAERRGKLRLAPKDAVALPQKGWK